MYIDYAKDLNEYILVDEFGSVVAYGDSIQALERVIDNELATVKG